MKVEDDGHLSLGACDFSDNKSAWKGRYRDLRLLNRDARIAVYYAIQAGHRIAFATPGILHIYTPAELDTILAWV